MASTGRMKILPFLLFVLFKSGTSSTSSVNITAIVGNNVSLPCTLSSENANVVQMQWHREVEGHQQGRLIVVYNLLFEKGEYSHSKGRLGIMQNPSDQFKRFYLDLEDLESEDSGVYVCGINTFPSGTIKQYVNLQVQELNTITTLGPVLEIDTENDRELIQHEAGFGTKNIAQMTVDRTTWADGYDQTTVGRRTRADGYDQDNVYAVLSTRGAACSVRYQPITIITTTVPILVLLLPVTFLLC